MVVKGHVTSKNTILLITKRYILQLDWLAYKSQGSDSSFRFCLVYKMAENNPTNTPSPEYAVVGPDWLLYPVARVILESDPQQVLQKVNYRVRKESTISNYQSYQFIYSFKSLENKRTLKTR